MSDLTIRHTWEDGTVLEGDPRPHHHRLKQLGWTWRPQPGWFVRGTRYHPPRDPTIQQAAAAMREAGCTVTVQVDPAVPDAATREQHRIRRAQERTRALDTKADRLDTQARDTLGRARQMGQVIPLGQPVMPDHHSYRTDLRYRDRVRRTYDQGFNTLGHAEDTRRRAQAARKGTAVKGVGETRRTVARLEADLRRTERAGGDTGPIREDLSFWQDHLTRLESQGHKVWGPGDFQPGGRVNDTATIVRVNRTTLTVRFDVFPPTITNRLPYDKVRSYQPPEEVNP